MVILTTNTDLLTPKNLTDSGVAKGNTIKVINKPKAPRMIKLTPAIEFTADNIIPANNIIIITAIVIPKGFILLFA
jgi:hypothetical protein